MDSCWLAALAVLSACAAEEPPEQLTSRFTSRPAHVLASSELPFECFDSLANAAAFFRVHRVSSYVTIADPYTTPALNGLAQPGVIAVLPDSLPMSPGKVVHGETRLSLTIGGDILGSEVSLASCDERAVAHELGHALGMVHLDEPGNLMHSELGLGGWELTADQASWVAD